MIKKLLLILAFATGLALNGEAQNKLSRPSSTPKVTSPKPKKTAPKPAAPKPSTPKTPSGTPANINGISLRWAPGVTWEQKDAITDILNSLVFVPYDHYWMGCEDYYSFPDERPEHYVEVNAFRIGAFEITQRQWRAIMGYNPSYFTGDNLPVTDVSWNDAMDFIKKINRLTGLKFNLPNETQWEYAAKGGRYNNNYRFSGSDNANQVGWTSENSGDRPHNVGQKPSNALGLFDMTGNVWEWTCSGWCDGYNSKRDYSSYVIRGGAFEVEPLYCRNTNRRHAVPKAKGRSMGFRVVLQ